MQIIKPKKLGLIHKTYQLQHHRFCISGFLFFRLDATATLLQEFEQWGAAASQLPPGSVLDMGFAKGNGEVLLTGKGYRPDNSVLLPARPGFKLGKLQKRTRLRVLDQSAKPLTAFSPLDINDRQRSRYNGTYDKHWLKHVHPGLPEDTDMRLFNAAPADQQFSMGKILPGQTYTLFDCHPQQRQWQGQLPDIRVRAFAKQQQRDTLATVEVGMQLETLWFFPEICMGLCLYRGEMPVNDSDGLDIKQLMLALETHSQAPRSQDYYHQLLALRSDPEKALGHLFNESQLMPERTPAQEQQRQEEIAAAQQAHQKLLAEQGEKIKQQAQAHLASKAPSHFPGQDKMHSALASGSDNAAEDDAFSFPVIPPEHLAAGDFDLTPIIDKARALEDKLNQEMEAKQQAAQALAASYQQQYGQDLAPLYETDAALQQRLQQQVFVVAEDLKQPLSQADTKVVSLLQKIPPQQLAELQQQGEINNTALHMALNAKAELVKQGRQHAPETMVTPALSDTQQQSIRQWVVELLASGGTLAGRDLSGADLSGLDFSGLDCRDLMLEGANVSGCQFVGTQLQGCVFTGAVLDGCLFSQAQLDKANFCQAKGAGVDFSGASMLHTLLTEAQLCEANFSAVKAEKMMAQTADLKRSNWSSAVLQECIFTGADLSHSHWPKSQLNSCILMQAVLSGSEWHHSQWQKIIAVEITGTYADFSHSRLTDVQFSNQGNLRAAIFDHSACKNVGFRGLTLTGLRARSAVFQQCDFCDADLQQADMSDSLFAGCLMMQVNGDKSVVTNSYFNETMLRKSRFSKADFRDVQFNQCTLTEAQFDDTDMQGSDIKPVASLG